MMLSSPILSLPRIAKRETVKRVGHEESLRESMRRLDEISEKIEAKVLKRSFLMKKDLDDIDTKINHAFISTGFVQREDIDANWHRIETVLKERLKCIENYGKSLNALEEERSLEVSQELRTLVNELIKIAHKSPGEIERIVEAEAMKVNTVLIMNRKAHSELLAVLRKEDTEKVIQAANKWQLSLQTWRKQRHEDALQNFQDDLESLRMPEARTLLFNELKTQFTNYDKRRTSLLKELDNTKQLTTVQVAEIQTNLKDLHQEECTAIQDATSSLNTISNQQLQIAQEKTESLRHELHTYGHLQKEPELDKHAAFFETQYIQNSDYDLFFRTAGGLKPELNALIKEYRSSSLAYKPQLDAALHRINILRCGTTLDVDLEKQGKLHLRTQLCETLERLRQASRSELFALLPTLQQRLNALLSSQDGLHQLLCQELIASSTDLSTLILEFEKATSPSAQRSSVASSAYKSTTRVSSRRPSSTVNSEFSCSSSDSVARNMLQVRAIQKRVAMHLRVCELPEAAKQRFDICAQDLSMKQTCNEKVDATVDQVALPLIALRKEEYQTLGTRIHSFLAANTSRASIRSLKICDYLHSVFSTTEHNAQREAKVDEKMLDDLYDLEEQFSLDVKTLEDEIALDLKNVSASADNDELKTNFQKALDALNRLEQEYRNYHDRAVTKAKEHPELVDQENANFEEELCQLFFLQTTDAADATFQSKYSELRSIDDFIEKDLYTDGSQTTEVEVEDTEASIDDEERSQEDILLWKSWFQPLSEDEIAKLGQEDLEAYLDRRDAAFIEHVLPSDDADDSPLKDVSEELKERYLKLNTEVQERKFRRDADFAAEAADRAVKWLQAWEMPLDSDGSDCLVTLSAPDFSNILQLCTELRGQVVETMNRKSRSRKIKITNLTQDRIKTFTDSFEERLRTHWPRRGRAEVDCREPRESELAAHKSRKLRHEKLFESRSKEQESAFRTRAVLIKDRVIDRFLAAIASLTATLTDQNSLASLQGVKAKCKKMAGAFALDCETQINELLEKYTEIEPRRLLQINEAMWKATRVFDEDGGEYSEHEAAQLRSKLDELESNIQSQVHDRKLECDRLKELRAAALADPLHHFQIELDISLNQLSERQGLGKKFGAPRRNAQEAFRTEQTCDEKAAKELDDLISSLTILCSTTQGKLDNHESVPTEEPRIFLSSLAEIRSKALLRARYLQLLPKPKAFANTADTPEKPSLREVIASIEESCRQETRELYEREGKAELLNADGVTQALSNWLHEAKQRVLGDDSGRGSGAGGHLERAKKLKEQILKIEQLMAKVSPYDTKSSAPRLAVSLLVSAEIASIRMDRDAKHNEFEVNVLKTARKQRQKNRETLHPRHGHAQFSGELSELCDTESNRCACVQAAAAAMSASVLEQQRKAAHDFVQELAKVVRESAALLDSTVFIEDLATLEGEENAAAKRKNLKRLRKQLRRSSINNPNETVVEERNLIRRKWPGFDLSVALGAEASPSTAELWTPLLKPISEPLEALVTAGHRALLKARDEALLQFYHEFNTIHSEVHAHFEAVVQDEQTWEQQWKSQIELLLQ